jgi:hypothetical protein
MAKLKKRMDKMSFIQPMKDKPPKKNDRKVLHPTYEGQTSKKEQQKSPSSNL